MGITTSLQNTSLFSSCQPKELARLIPYITLKEVKENEYLFRSGTPAGELYFVKEGVVRLVSGNHTVGEVSNGFLGEELAAGAEYYISDAIAVSPAVVLRLPRRALDSLLDAPGIKSNFLLSLFNRYFRTNLAQSPISPMRYPVSSPGSGSVPGWIAVFLAPFKNRPKSGPFYLDNEKK